MAEDGQKNLLPQVEGIHFSTRWPRPHYLGTVISHRTKPGSRVEKLGKRGRSWGRVDDSRSALGKLEFSGTSERETLPLRNNFMWSFTSRKDHCSSGSDSLSSCVRDTRTEKA